MKLLCLLIALALVGTSVALPAQAAVRHQLSIPRQPLDSALKEFAKQTGLQVARFTDTGATADVGPLTGSLTVEQALRALLAETGLTWRMVNDRTVAVIGANSDISLDKRGERDSAEDSGPPVASSVWSRLRFAAAERSAGSESPSRSDDPGTHDASASEARLRSGQSRAMEEVIVTAQKREERLIDTPQSVSVLSANELAKIGATQFRDFANTVPGLSFVTAGAGNTQVSMRGVTIGQDLGATVGIYVDEAPYGSSQVFAFGPYLALDVGLFDIDRIEVLRGPHGTLYGASTMGGLIKYVTKRPDTEQFAGDVRAGISSTERGDINYNVATAVNLPIVADKAALRASAFQSHDGGYINNVASGREGANRSDIYGGRVDLLLTPIEPLELRLTGFAQNIARDGEATADYTFSGARPLGSLNQNRLFDEPFGQQFRLVSGTVGYDFGRTSLTSISTYQTVRTNLTWDISGTFAPLLNMFGFGPFSAVGNPNRSKVNKFSQEVRWASEGGGAAEWVLGGFYTREKSELGTEFLLRDLAGNPAPNTLFTYRAPTLFEEQAIFGDVTWRLASQFDVTAGLRYARNDQEFTQFGSGAFGFNLPTRESDEDVVTYLASARYHVSDRATTYLRYATGYRPGGPNIATIATAEPTFDSDKLKSYEAGFKAETGNRRLAIDLAGYYIDWNNIQMSVNVGGFTSYLNAPGGASVRGAELALTGRPTTGLALSGAFSYQDAQLDEADANLGGAKGERLPNVPRFMTTLNADYDFSGARLRPTLGATVRYVGERRSSFDASTSFRQYRLPEYTAVDLRAGLKLRNIETQLYVHNVADERGQLSLFFAQFGARVAILQPRTVGLSVTTEF